jgi:hypothetical protein
MKVYMVATERRRRFTPKPRVAAQPRTLGSHPSNSLYS